MACNQKRDQTPEIIGAVAIRDDMAPEARRHEVLTFLSEYPLALKPSTIHRNMCLHRHITFGQETVLNILQERTESGDLRRVDPTELPNRRLVDLDPGEGRGVYIITEQGRERAQSLGR